METVAATLDVAQELLLTRGFNVFSIKDLAERVHIRTSTVPYYFPTKGDLGGALVARQRRVVAQALDDIDGQARGAKTKLKRLATLFENSLDAGYRMCLCGMLAAECSTLDPGSRPDPCESFNDYEIRLTRVLTRAKEEGELSFADKPRDVPDF